MYTALTHYQVVDDTCRCRDVMENASMTGGEPLQRVADGDICVAQEANLAPLANRPDETIHCQGGSREESSEQQV